MREPHNRVLAPLVGYGLRAKHSGENVREASATTRAEPSLLYAPAIYKYAALGGNGGLFGWQIGI